jgi:hypothetical protein
MEPEFSKNIFEQSSNIKFHDNPSNSCKAVHVKRHTDGWIDRQDEPTSLFAIL